jgi:hypothetical protein
MQRPHRPRAMDQRRREGREITSSACPPSDLDPPPRSGHPGARPSAFCSVSARGPIGVSTPATAAPQVRHRRLIRPLPVGHLDHDDTVLVITGDAPAAALPFGHGPAPFRGSDAGACDEVDLGQWVATAHLQRIPAQEPPIPPTAPTATRRAGFCMSKENRRVVRRRCGLVGSACSCSLSCSPESSG